MALLGGALVAQAPPGYYASVDATDATTLRATLHAVIDDHTVFPYTSGSTDTWNILEAADEDPSNASRIVDIYRNASYAKVGGGNGNYQREHTWPKSYGFPIEDLGGPYTDCHQLRLCDGSYNAERSNKPFANCSAGCVEWTTLPNNGVGGGSGVYPGNSNWTAGVFSNGSWEVWDHRKGDIARAMFYMDVRYEGGTHGGTGTSEPDLILTDNRSLIGSSSTGSPLSVAYMGLLSTLVQWHWDDPPDAEEMERNDTVFTFQGNRNPFVDNPGWVGTLWGGGPAPTPGLFESYGMACPGTNGLDPMLSTTGTPTINANLDIVLANSVPLNPVVLHIDFQQSAISLFFFGFPTCAIYAMPTIPVAGNTSFFGSTFVSLQVPDDPNMIGFELYGQWLILEAAQLHLSASNGGKMVLGSQ